jgi:uncharacterized membrane protein
VNSESSRILHSLQRNIVRGVITAGPLFITWLVFTFILGVLASAGLPLVKLLGLPFPADSWVNHPWPQYGLAVLVMVGLFYLIGRATSQVVGRQAFALFEASLERLPLVNKIYSSVRQLIETLASKNQAAHRVVLIDFPIAGQKSIGFLTHMIADATTGAPLAAVLVPQAINPSSAYLQFVPMEMVTETDLTMEQAMSMLLTGGAVCPEAIRYSAPGRSREREDGARVGSASGVKGEPRSVNGSGGLQGREFAHPAGGRVYVPAPEDGF